MPLTPGAYPTRLNPSVLFQHARRQPFLDQADDSTISDPILDETHQPFSAELIERGN
jgi:hypothetical protein